MRVLLDTNIFIEREDNRVLNSDLQDLLKLLNDIGAIIMVHPKCVDELKNDKDDQRRGIVLSKIKSYTSLESPPNPLGDGVFELNFGNIKEIENTHELTDLHLLYSVYRNAVEFLITEDRGISSKADKIGLDDRVFCILDAITVIRELIEPKKEVYTPPAILKKPLHNLKLEDSFFDDLRNDYGITSFNNWFTKKAKEGKDAYVYFNSDGSLGAFLMLKDENEELNSKPDRIQKKRRLKICTLKVSSMGNKLGELFLNISFKFAIQNNIPEIYLTHFIKNNDRLIPLIEKFGFERNPNHIEHEHTQIQELIYTKPMLPDSQFTIQNLRDKYFPCFYDGEAVNKFLVPIRPQYHGRLFIDVNKRQTTIGEFFGEFIVEGNTILKAYICNAPTNQIKENDILLFYRTIKDKAVTSICTVDAVFYKLKDVDEIINKVAKRTVYSKKEIELFDKPLTVILFKFHFHLPQEIEYGELIRKEILSGPAQTITKLDHKDYVKLKRLSKIDPKFTRWELPEVS